MAIITPVYASREDVKSAPDVKSTARVNAQIDRLLQSATLSINGMLHYRHLYPLTATRTFDWTTTQSPTPWRLWLDDKTLISVSALSSGGIAIPPSDYQLRPDTGPPFDRIELDISTQSAFSVGPTYQRAISATGVWGHSYTTVVCCTLVEVLDSSETGVDISDGSAVGVGDLLIVDSERMLVTERGWLSSGQTLQTPVTASAAGVALLVSDGTAFVQGETLLLDAERMLVTDVAGNTLIVKRAWDGSVLASHTGSTVYVSRTLSVLRGQLGTSAVGHSNGTAVYRWVPPYLANQLAIAEVSNALQQEESAYARTIGSGETAIEAKGVGLVDIRLQACTTLGRKSRTRAV